jgi:cAMP phosphodiesterase
MIEFFPIRRLFIPRAFGTWMARNRHYLQALFFRDCYKFRQIIKSKYISTKFISQFDGLSLVTYILKIKNALAADF